MKKSKQKKTKEENLEFVPSLKPDDDDISDFKQRPEKKPNGNATLGDILRQPGEPDEKVKPVPKAKKTSSVMPLVFMSAALLIILGVVSGALFSKFSVLEQQVMALSTDKIQGSSNNTATNQAVSIDKDQFEELQKDLKDLKALVYARNKNSIANNTEKLRTLRNATKDVEQAIKILDQEIGELKTLQADSVSSNKSSKTSSNVSNAALKRLEKKQAALDKRLAKELISLKKLESTVKNIGKNAPVPSGGGANSADLTDLKNSLAKLEKQIKANDESIDKVEIHNDKLKRSISLLRAESARVYRLVESSMNK